MRTHAPLPDPGRLRGRSLAMLGGTGPAATVHLHRLTVEVAQQVYGASADTDFPAITVLNRPLPGMDASGRLRAATDITRQVQANLDLLASLGNDVILACCNSLDAALEPWTPATPGPAPHLVRLPVAAAAAAQATGVRCLGLLGSAGSRLADLHGRQVRPLGIGTVLTTNDEQTRLDRLIAELMAAPATPAQADELARLALALRRRGADTVLIGCTELSMLTPFRPPDAAVPWLDAARCGVEAALQALASLTAGPAPGERQDAVRASSPHVAAHPQEHP